ncbi:YoaK family protein [Mycolicibacter arupensis]|uniref:YoaK family protein n=1 Tax=Mycolicibacter arupensis TaxID=342002 RepID=UPI003B3A5336
MPIASPLSKRRTVAALLLLTFATGLVDAVSVLVLGRVFVANMTGNAIFLGFLFVPGTGFDLTAAIVAVGGFLAGAIIGGRLFRIFAEEDPRRWLTVALGLEAALLLLLAGLAGVGVLRYDGISKLVLTVGLAVAFGVQNSTARQFGVQELYTTVLTSTIVGIGVDSRLAGGGGGRQRLRYTVVFVMIFGAIVGATLTHVVVAPVIALGAVVVLTSMALFRYG